MIVLLSALLLVCGLASFIQAASVSRRYCIIGAGPAGVQLGHFLKRAGRDYIIYEKARSAGNFFRNFPRHRTLISLNKRVVREGRSAEFAMRHDWNSLLDLRSVENRTKPVTQRSKALFPHADVLAQYIDDFAEEQAEAIQYGVEVRRLRRIASRVGTTSGGRASGKVFELKLARRGSREQETSLCEEVIIATGLSVPRGAESVVDGVDHVREYEQLPETGEDFEGQAVIVLGMGNAALETTQTLQPFTSELHLLGRRRELPEGGMGVRFAHQTHYVGDIRAGRTTILDTYLLKSLDTFTPEYLENGLRLVVLPCVAGRLCVFQGFKNRCTDKVCQDGHDKGLQNLNYMHQVLMWPKGGRFAGRVHRMLTNHGLNETHATQAGTPYWAIREQKIGQLDSRMGSPEERKAGSKARKVHGISDKVYDQVFEVLYMNTNTLRSYPRMLDELQMLRANHSGDDTRYPIDHIIRCFGWKMATSMFDKSVPVSTTHHGKYPEITSGYEAKKVPGLYFAGTLTHGLDFRRSAGGFVHGFRYTARALFRLLEEKAFDVPWPQATETLKLNRTSHPSVVQSLALALHRRINEAAGPYQMFQSLGDMIVMEEAGESDNGNLRIKYLEEVPLDLFHSRFKNAHRLTWVFKYGEDFYGKAVFDGARAVARDPMHAYHTKFLHPHLAFYQKGRKNAEMQHWMLDDIFTQWNDATVYLPLVRFVARALAGASGIKDWWKGFNVGEPGDIDEEWWSEPVVDLHQKNEEAPSCAS